MLDLKQLSKKADRLWPSILKSRLSGEALFPWTIPLGPPSGRDLMERFDQISVWIKEIRHLKQVHKFEIRETKVNHRQIGTQSLPTHLVVPDLECYLKWRRKGENYRRFCTNLDQSLELFPSLRSWITAKPLTLDREQEVWPKILRVLEAMQNKPWPQCFLRSFHIPGVDSKFIENHRQILDSLLPLILQPQDFIAEGLATSLRGFCEKYGFHFDYHLIRFRWLDRQLNPCQLDDLSVPLPDFASFDPLADTVFLTENKANGLAFPEFPRAIVIFGLGGGIESLKSARWLQSKKIYYWGDIDSHGFAILARLREFLPETKSILMDQTTLHEHREAWGEEPSPKLSGFPWEQLNQEEQMTFESLPTLVSGKHVRLEQEHVTFPYLVASLDQIT